MASPAGSEPARLGLPTSMWARVAPPATRSTPARPLGRAGIKRAVAEHRPKMVFLTSPNNPDGSMLSTEELLEILELPVLVGAQLLSANCEA